jgi:hypothetical protein
MTTSATWWKESTRNTPGGTYFGGAPCCPS